MGDEDAVTVVGIVLIVVDILAVVGRFYSRWYTKSGFGWDDWTILIALLTGFLPGALTIWAGTVSSTGPAAASNFDPDYIFTPEDVIYTKITLPMSALYFLVTSTTKVVLSYLPDSREPDFSRAALWTTVHLYLGIACANMPPSWPLFHRAARLSTGSWAKLSSISRHWYSMSSGHLSRNNGVNKPQSTPTAKTWNRDGSTDIEVGQVGLEYELSSMNYWDTETIDDGGLYRPS